MSTALRTGEENLARRKEPQAVLYSQVPQRLKERFDRIAEAHGRKIKAEVTRMMERYCDQEERLLAQERAEQEDQ